MSGQRDLRRRAEEPTPSPPGARHAVVVGINQYADSRIRDLSFARADAEGVYQKLVDPDLGGFAEEDVVLLVDEQATQRNIVSAIGTRLRRTASENDLVCIYYAGHGAIDPDPGAEDGLQKYIVPHDGDVDDLFSTGIPMTRVEEFFRRLTARQIVFFLDSCYSGGANGRTFQNPRLVTRSVLTNTFLERLGARGRFVVTSCAPNEVSLESVELGGGHGVFTHYLLRGLAGEADRDQDGFVTMGELFDYLTEHVSRHAQRLGGSMTPIKTGSTEGRIYLTRYETETQKAAKALEMRAGELQRSGKVDDAEAAWRELATLVPGHEVAVRALDAIATAREEERKRQEEAERARVAELQRGRGVLYGHFRAEELDAEAFDEAMSLLDREDPDLTEVERELRDLVDHLVSGRIQPAAYRASRQLVKEQGEKTTGEGAEAGAVAPGMQESPPEEERHAGPPGPSDPDREGGSSPESIAGSPESAPLPQWLQEPIETGPPSADPAVGPANERDPEEPAAILAERPDPSVGATPESPTASEDLTLEEVEQPPGPSGATVSVKDAEAKEPWRVRGPRAFAYATAAALCVYLYRLLASVFT